MRFILVAMFGLCAWAQDAVPGRYLVELTDQPALARQGNLNRIRAGQRQLAARLAERRLPIRGRLEHVANALIVEGSDATTLAALPGVRRVTPVVRLRPLLDRAVVTHEIKSAWEAIGATTQAGAGIRIAIIDSGIDPAHPGFQAPELAKPEAAPEGVSEANAEFLNNKIIVARSYDGEPARDTTGHGTAVAMAAAGVIHEAPKGTIGGVAPGAWLGIYRADNLADHLFYSDTVLLALEDAVKDKMDIINLSIGSPGLYGGANGIFAEAMNRLNEAGILVVNAVGNTPGPMMVDDRASHAKVLGVGANKLSAAVQPAVVPSIGKSMPAAAGDGLSGLEPITGSLTLLGAIDPSETACNALAEGQLTAAIVLVVSGDCEVPVKLTNLAAAGAKAVVLYNGDGSDAEAVVLLPSVVPPILPVLSLGNSDGLKLKEYASTNEDFQVQLRFPFGGKAPTGVAGFSSSGPSPDLAIKPDLVASGAPLYTAAKKGTFDPATCPVCDPSGYANVQGTSFATPLVSGAAAVLKAARPGLTLADYRSLLVNGTSPLLLSGGTLAAVTSAGAGYLNLLNAVQATVTAEPATLSLASGPGTIDLSKPFTLKNLTKNPGTWTLAVESADQARPELNSGSLTLEAGASGEVQLQWKAAELAPGAYQGYVTATDAATGTVARIPYWYAVEGGEPVLISVVSPGVLQAAAGSTVQILFRVHDAAGLALIREVTATAATEGLKVVSLESAFDAAPGIWVLQVQLLGGAEPPRVRIDCGELSKTFEITVL